MWEASLALGIPALLPLSAELTTVWGTSKDPGGHASAQESQTEGGSVGQPAPGSPHSPPPDLPSPQHHFSSKMVCAEHPSFHWTLWRGEPVWPERCRALTPSPRPRSSAQSPAVPAAPACALGGPLSGAASASCCCTPSAGSAALGPAPPGLAHSPGPAR